VSYERGRLMPLFRGATARIILAHLPTRNLKTVFARSAEEIAATGLGNDWTEFRRNMVDLRRAGFCISRSEIDPGRVGVAAPIFNDERSVLGSLSFVLPGERADDTLIGRLAPLTVAGAREIERAMMRSNTTRPSSARVKLAR
jgi:DNA-binding IclR family transcriptional regulator